MSVREEMRALEASLERRFRTMDTTIAIGARTLSILHPASSEDLIDEREFERDERLPYWAELWPSSRVLAERVMSMDGAGRSMLDLGCGAGLVAVGAVIAGFRVVASDYYDDAIRFARLNAWRNCHEEIGGLPLDWRRPPAELERFDAVVASDVLYERPYGELVARMIERTLATGGVAYLADPGRVAREPFLTAVRKHSLEVRSRDDVPFIDGPIRQTISIFEIGRR